MKIDWRSPIAGAALIILLTAVAYLPATRVGFLWDDNLYVTENQAIRSLDGLRRIWTTRAAQRYYPLVSTGFWAQYHLWKLQPLGYHLVNILLHALNAVLIWLILQRLKIPGAWFAGLVFAVHPVNVATVAWVSEQKNTLSMLFYAVAILLYLRFDEEGRWRWYGWSLLAFLLALLSKTAVVMLPVVLLACVWWRRGRVRRNDLLRSVPFFALSLALGLLTIRIESSAIEGLPVRTVGFLSRLADAGSIPWFYLYKALLPLNLTVIYPKWEMDPFHWVSYVPGIILIGCFAWFWRNRDTWGRPLLFGLGYFVVTLFPVLGFFDQSFYYYSLVADHWQYYSIIGVIALTVATGERICRRWSQQRRFSEIIAGVAVLVILSAATWQRGCIYADAEMSWRDNMAKNPKSAVVRNNLGFTLVQIGRTQEGIAQYEQALRLAPDYSDAHYNLGIVLVQVGRVPEAIAHYEQALWIAPNRADAYNNLGIAMARMGRLPEAIANYEQALRVQPDYVDAHYNLGIALARMGRVPEAMEHWQQALQIRPDYAEAHYNLGVTLAQMGRVPDAIAHYEQAVRIRPDYIEAHYNLGNALADQGRSVEALNHFQKALDSARSQGNTGLVDVVQARLKLYESNPAHREKP